MQGPIDVLLGVLRTFLRGAAASFVDLGSRTDVVVGATVLWALQPDQASHLLLSSLSPLSVCVILLSSASSVLQ